MERNAAKYLQRHARVTARCSPPTAQGTDIDIKPEHLECANDAAVQCQQNIPPMHAICGAGCTAGVQKGLLCDQSEHSVHALSHAFTADPVFTNDSQSGTASHNRSSTTHKRLAQSWLQLACCPLSKLTARWSTPAREWRPPAARPAYALLTAWRTAAEGEHKCQSEAAFVPALKTMHSLFLQQPAASIKRTQMASRSHAFEVTKALLMHNTLDSLPCIAVNSAASDRLTFS